MNSRQNFYIQLFLFLGMSILTNISSAQACFCEKKPELQEALANASLVFVGQVKEKTENPLKRNKMQVKFIVNRKFKGFEEVPGNFVLIYTPIDAEECGYNFAEGLDYLVFATGTPANFQTTTCSRSEVLDKVLVDVQKLIRLTSKPDELQR